jgi:hypothetical protein
VAKSVVNKPRFGGRSVRVSGRFATRWWLRRWGSSRSHRMGRSHCRSYSSCVYKYQLVLRQNDNKQFFHIHFYLLRTTLIYAREYDRTSHPFCVIQMILLSKTSLSPRNSNKESSSSLTERNVIRLESLPIAILLSRTAKTPGRQPGGIQRTSLAANSTHWPVASSEY